MLRTDIQSPEIYRALQKHLDRQPVGFPATNSGIELKVLAHIFSPEQAQIATCLSEKAKNAEEIFKNADGIVDSISKLVSILDEMVNKGGIETGEKDGKTWYRNVPLVVGMYEFQLGRLTPEFIRDFDLYSGTKEFGLAFLNVKPPQMRTIPVRKSIQINGRASLFDDVKHLIQSSPGPFAVCECICRKKQKMSGHACKVTKRDETCLAVGHLAQMAEKTGMGRLIPRDEAIEILAQNQKQGLVLQPSNSQEIDFICSCCGCCCGMLRTHKKLPKPLEFWSTNHVAVIDQEKCTACGRCRKKCQVDAIRTDRKKEVFRVDQNRCIGCGICVSLCPVEAVSLLKVDKAKTPPETREDLLLQISKNQKGTFKKTRLVGKLFKDAVTTGRFDILK